MIFGRLFAAAVGLAVDRAGQGSHHAGDDSTAARTAGTLKAASGETSGPETETPPP